MSSEIPLCGANQLLFSVYHKVINGIFCLQFSGLRDRLWLFIYLFIIDRAREGARILRENFSLLPKKGHLPGNLEILILDTLNVFLLSL